MAKTLKIPYGIKDFKRIRTEGYYYVNKTAYIRKMEERDSFVFFVRPRRMGKSLFVETLRCYYDVNEKANFRKLFGGLDVGENPTENANKYLMLSLDFSLVDRGSGMPLEDRFENYLSARLNAFLYAYAELFEPSFMERLLERNAADKFNEIVSRARLRGREIYLVIDEYDNFTNTMMRDEADPDYRSVTHGAGFYRNWFKAFKEACSRIFMTGVSPVTMDDLTSGFNIAANLTQLPAFNAMAGFSEAEVVKMYSDFKGTGGLQGEIRVQGYMQAEFGHLKFYLLAPEMELAHGFCDFCLFPERVHYGDVLHSYLVELKYAKADASDAEMAAKVDEAKAQLAKYRADSSVPSLARGTALHQIVYVFRGSELHTLEEIAYEPM